VVVVDDSLVRGTTSRSLVRMLRGAGADEVHFRIGSPPVKWPCFYGIDMPTKGELIGSELEVPEIAGELGVESLGYLSLQGMVDAVTLVILLICPLVIFTSVPISWIGLH
jgi:amidophosphoribosyltransferase